MRGELPNSRIDETQLADARVSSGQCGNWNPGCRTSVITNLGAGSWAAPAVRGPRHMVWSGDIRDIVASSAQGIWACVDKAAIARLDRCRSAAPAGLRSVASASRRAPRRFSL